jgi:hypothetical protein
MDPAVIAVSPLFIAVFMLALFLPAGCGAAVSGRRLERRARHLNRISGRWIVTVVPYQRSVERFRR